VSNDKKTEESFGLSLISLDGFFIKENEGHGI